MVNTRKLSSHCLRTPSPGTPLTCTPQLIAHVSGRPNARCVLRTGDGPVCSSLLLLTVPGCATQVSTIHFTTHRQSGCFLLLRISNKAAMNALARGPLRGAHAEGLNGQVTGLVDMCTIGETAEVSPMAGPAYIPLAVWTSPSCFSLPSTPGVAVSDTGVCWHLPEVCAFPPFTAHQSTPLDVGMVSVWPCFCCVVWVPHAKGDCLPLWGPWEVWGLWQKPPSTL